MYLFGASGHAKVIMDILRSQNMEIEGLVDDNPLINELNGYKVYHQRVDLSPIIVSIGINAVRKKVVNKLEANFGKAIDRTAIVSSSATIGEGTVVMQGAIIQADAKIGKHCIINTGSSVDHECILGDYVHVSPHATLCGNVTVGEGSWIGAGAVIKQGVKIGQWVTVGAGAVVVKDISDNLTVVGVPAQII